MTKFFTKWLEKLFANQHQSVLEKYIAAHNPKHLADVEYLERKYYRKGVL